VAAILFKDMNQQTFGFLYFPFDIAPCRPALNTAIIS
jgi:hypothetical protein